MKISLIVAMAENRAIGFDGKMPWHLPADLKRFKQITMGKPVLMGRKTFEAIGRPLPGRENLIVSRSEDFAPAGCKVFADIDAALCHSQGQPELFVIGGATLYQALLPRADRLYLTRIAQSFSGDTYFPEINPSQWVEVSNQQVVDDPAVGFSYAFVNLVRV